MKIKHLNLVFSLVLILFFLSNNAIAAIITSTATGGSWGTTSTWVGNAVPLTTDQVVIATTGGNSVSVGANTTCAGLTINFGSKLDIAAFTFTVNGDITINGIWNETGAATVVCSGSFSNNSTTFTTSTGTHTFSGAAKIFSGASFTSIANIAVTGTYTNNNSLTIGTALTGGGGLTNAATGILNIGGTSTITTLTATATGNTVNYAGGAQTVKSTTYSNLTLSGSGAKTTTTVTVNGVLSLEGTATVSTVPTYGSGATLQYNKPAAFTVGVEWPTTFSGSGGVIIANTGAITRSSGGPYTIQKLTINSGARLNFNRALTVMGTTSVSGAIYWASSSGTARAVALTGDVTLNSGAVWNEPATGNGSTNTFNFGGNFTNNATTFNAAGTGVHTFSGATKTISGSTVTSIGSVAVTGSPTNTGTFTVRTALSGAGNLTNGTNGILNLGGTANVTTLTATAAGNLVNYYGVAQTAKVTTYNNLTFSGSGIKTFASSLTVNGILSIEGTATVVVTVGVMAYGANATLQYNTATARTASTEEWISPFVGTGGIIIKNTGAITTPGAVQIGNNTSVPLNINNGATLTPGANLLTFHGDFINAGTLTNGSGGVTIAGTVATQSIGGFTTTGTVTLTKTSGTATLIGSVNGGALTVNGSGGNLNLGSALTHSFSGIVTLTAGTLNGGSSILNINAVSSTAWNGTGTVFSAGTGTVNFSGAGAQTLSATATTFNNLTVSNSGLKTFSNTPTVTGVFSLEDIATVSAAPTYGSNATLQYNTSTSRTTGAEWITPFISAGGVIIANTGTISMDAAKVFNSTAPLTVNSGASLSMSTYLLTLNGNLINNGGTASGTTGGVTLAGTATQTIGAFTTTGTISVTKTGGTATLTGNVNGAGLTINGSGGTLNLGTGLTHTFTGNVTLTAGSLNGGSSTLNENNISTSAWNGTGSVFTPANSTINFGASGAQTLSASSLSFHNLSLSGSGNKTFTSVVTIGNNLSISGSGAVKINPGTYDHNSVSLTFDGVNQLSGTWGGSASSPSHVSDTYFLSTATGIVNVNCTAPSAPVSGGNQTICNGQTIPALSVTVSGGTANWFSQEDGGTSLITNSLTYTPVAAGTYYAEAVVNACNSATRTGVTLTINSKPVVLSISGSTICASPDGNGTITSTTSQSGVSYQLYNSGNSTVQDAKAGTGSGLTWTGLSSGNGYYIIGTNSTTNCSSTSNSVNISTTSNPVTLILTGDIICTSPGGDGNIVSTTSENGVNYQLYNAGNTPVQSAQAGTGAGIEWSSLTAGTGYYVIGTNATTACVSTKSSTVDITTTANPVALTLTGSTICVSPDGNGTITSSSSQTGVDYQLYDITDIEVGSPVPGTGAALRWSGLTIGSGYYAVGVNAGLCVSANSNAVDVSPTPNPTITSSATANSVCFSSSVQSSVLSYSAVSNSPTTYIITWNSSAHTAGLADGSATSLPSPPNTVNIPIAANVAAGTYTGTLTVYNAASCASQGNSFTVTINNSPAAPTGTATQILCNGATVANLSATGTGILWYSAPSSGTPLATSSSLVNVTHYFASQTLSGCESSGRLNVTANVLNSGSWIGTTSNWFTPTNWCGGSIPTASTNITIPAGLTNYPSIGTSGAVCNNMTIESGASLTITSTNILTVSGDWTNNGTFNANNSTVDFNGTGAGNIGASNFYNVTFSGAGTKTATGSLTIAGNVSITGNFTAGAYTHSVSGNWAKSGTFAATGSTIDFNGSGAGNIGSSNFYNITFSGAGTKTATGALTIAGNVNLTNNFTAGSYTHTVGGNWSKSRTFAATGSTIDFNGSGAGNISASNFNHIIFSGAGIKTATGNLSLAGNITISNNFNAGNYIHTLLGNWSNNGTFNGSTSTFSFNGASSQTINGSSSSTFNNLSMIGVGGATLGISTSVAGTLSLNSGKIDIGNYNLIITSSGSINGGSASSYVKTSGTGRLKQTVPGSGSITKAYPVGNSAYNPMSVKYNDYGIDNFSVRVADGAITNANDNTKTVNRKWYLIEDASGTSNLTISETYNSGEESSGFNNSTAPKIGYFDGTSWAYRGITSGSATTTFTSEGSAPDFTNTSGFFVLGSDDAFNATKLAVTKLEPVNPSKGIANTIISIQAQNSNSIPTMVGTATGFSLTATNTTMSTSPTGTINQYSYETTIPSITFTKSTINPSPPPNYNHNATITATGTSGEALSAGTSAAFDVYEGAIYEPKVTEDWDAPSGWRKSTDGGSTWTDPASLPAGNVFADNELIRIPLGITLTANVTASFYSMLVYGTLNINSSGNLTLNHSSSGDYNIHVHEGTLKNSGGTLTNNNGSYPSELIEIHGGTYEHTRDGGSIPICLWYSNGTTLSNCVVDGITSNALTGGLNQTFENFTWNNASQAVTQNLNGDMTVNGALILTAGKITTGNYHVIVGLAGTASNAGAGYINGTLRRYVASTVTTGDFPIGDANYYTPFSISCTGTPSGNGYLDLSTTAAQPSQNSGLSQSNYINRKWTITNNGVTGITAYSPSFTFVNGDKVGSPTTVVLRKLTGSTWYTTNGTTASNTITATGLSTSGLTATSDFYIGEDACSSTYAIWLGNTSTDWNTATNWCSGSVPNATTDVTIPSAPGHQPVIGASGASCRNITIAGGAILTISGTYTLDVHGAWSNSGTFTANTGTVSFTGSSSQTITGATAFNGLTINNTAGVTAANDIIVNGLLTLTSENPDLTHGALDMGSYTLSMLSESASVSGTGDVTGIIKRRHTFTPNVPYQFGSQYTTLNFLNTGTQPDELSCSISIGTAPSGKTGAVKRYYIFKQTGFTGTDQIVANLRYLVSELNGNVESKLVFWDKHPGEDAEEHGKTNNNMTNHWVGLAGFTIDYFAPSPTDPDVNKPYFLANSTVTKNMWLGADETSPTKWNVVANWSGGHIPLSTDDILIPGGKSYYPILTLSVAVNSIEIESGASITADTCNITIRGYNLAWQNNGTFYPGTGTVILNHDNDTEVVSITGSTQFHNITITGKTFVRPGTGTLMQISGDVNGDLNCIVDLSAFGNTVEYNGTLAHYNGSTTTQYIINPATSGFALTGYYNLIISGTGSKTLFGDQLDISGNYTNNGTLDVGGATVSFIGTSTQDISGNPVFGNLAINNPAGVTASTDMTVNGILNLESDNPSLVAGSLAMNSDKILNMGATSSSVGLGDVTGIIKRTHTFVLNTEYSFGNINTLIIFPYVAGQTLPSSATLKVTLGSAPVWGTGTPANAINRVLDVAQTGGNGTHAIIRSHFRSNELPGGVNQNLLSMWIDKVGVGIYEKGESNISTLAGYSYITIQDVNLAVIPSDLTNFHVAIAPTGTSYHTWNGSYSTDWNNASNWTPNGAPTISIGAVIPDANTTVNQPTLPANGSTQAECQYIIIETNGVLNAGTDATLTLSDGVIGDAWGCRPGGTFNAGSSTVIFTTDGSDFASISGNTNFNNLTITTGSKLRPAANSYIGIGGALTIAGTGIFAAATNENTIEFSGGNTQTIPNPNGSTPGYHKLILSGSGTKTFPAILNIVDELKNNTSGTIDNNSGTVIFSGNQYGQTLSGTTVTSFNNLTIDNIYGLSLVGIDAGVSGNLTFTNGRIATAANKIIVGSSSSCSSGTITGAGEGKYIYGNLRRFVSDGATTVAYDIGDSTNFTPVTVTFSGTTSGCGYLDAYTMVSQPPLVSGLSQTKYINRKWTLVNNGVSGFSSYSPTFTFVEGDKIGSLTTSALVIRKFNGSAWLTTTTGAQEPFSTQATGLTSFSEYEIGEDACSGISLWLGAISSDWKDGRNWCSGIEPTSSDNVVIPSGTSHQPHIGSTGSGSCNDLTIYEGATLTMDGAYNIDIYGNWFNNGTFTQSTSTVNFRGTGAQTINGATTFSTLKVNNAAGVTLGVPVTVSTLTIGDVTSNSVLSDEGFQITSTGTLNFYSGTFKLGSGSASTNYPAFATSNISSGTTVDYGSSLQQTIAAVNYSNLTNTGNGQRIFAPSGTIGISGTFTTGSGSYIVTGSTVDFNGTNTQSINGITYNNLTISGSGNNNKSAVGNITVNGILNLNSANYTASQGALHMGLSPEPEYILYMGPSATTIGTGDVCGYINRSSFNLNTDYTFGNQYTLMNFTVGPLPTSVTLEVYLTASDINWKTNAIHRYFDITRSGGSPATRLRFNVHYLDDELNGATEGNLDFFDYHVDGSIVHDHGRTDYNTINNWVGFSNVGLSFLGIASPDDHFWTLGTNSTNGQSTWIGGSPSGNTDWDLPGNWDGGVPDATSHVVIPAGLTYYPILPVGPLPDGSLSGGRIINTMDIQYGGTLYANSGTPTLTIAGADNVWMTHGTFNAGTSTVLFTNAAAVIDDESYFYNVTIADGAKLTLGTDNYLGIAGVLSLSSTGVLDSWSYSNIVDYNGCDQTVIKPVVPRGQPNYHNLILSGTGTKTMPSDSLYLHGEFIMNGTATATAGGVLTIHGTHSNIRLGSGTTFTAGSFTHSLFGNLENNGATLNTTGSTFNFNGIVAQTIGGTSASTFNNLTINNSSGVALGACETVAGTLSLTNGKLSLGDNILTLNTTTTIAGSPGNSNYIVYSGIGKLVKNIPAAMGSPYLFPIGTATNYSPATFKFNSGTVDGTSSLMINLTEGKQPDISAPNYINRYWTYSPSGTFSSPNYDADFTYVDGDIVGTESTIMTAKYSNGWLVYSHTNSGSNLLSITGATSFSDYTGFGDLAVAPSAATNPICSGSSTTISANATGGTAPYSYSWTVPAGVSDPGNADSFSATVAGTYAVTVTDNISATMSGSMVLTVNSLPTVTFTAQPGINACLNVDVTYTTQSGNSSYAWSVPGVLNTDYSITSGGTGSSDYTVTLKWLTTGNKTVTINYTDGNGCTAASATSSTTTEVYSDGTWTGSTSTDWNVASNWCGGAVPSAITDVIIPDVNNKPVIGSVGGLCRNITIRSGASLEISSSYSLTVSGNWVNNGGSLIYNTSSVTFDGASKSIGGTSSTTFYDLSLSGSASISNGVATTIGHNLSIGDGTSFNAGAYNLTIAGTTTVGEGSSGTLVISSATGTKTFGGLVTVSSGATWNNSGNSDVTFKGGITKDGDGTFTSGTGTHTFNTNDQELSGVTIAIQKIMVTGKTLTNKGTLNVGTGLDGSGTLMQDNYSTLYIGGTSTITTLTAIATENIVSYNGSSQSIKSTNYYNLKLEGSGTYTMQNGTTSIAQNFSLSGLSTLSVAAVTGLAIGGNFYINSHSTFNAASFTHTIGGDFQNDGSFIAATSTIQFNGSQTQTIKGIRAATFNNLTINNTAGVSLSNSPSVNGTLTFSNGKISTGANVMIFGESATISGAGTGKYVNGLVRKNFATNCGTQSFDFPLGDGSIYTPATLDMKNVNAGTNPVNITAHIASSDASESYLSGISQNKKANRYWFTNLNSVPGSFDSYDITLNLSNTTNSGTSGGSISNYIIKKFDPNAWASTTSGVTNNDDGHRTIKATGLTTFSDWEAGEGCSNPTASVTKTEVTCYGSANGSITISPTYGTPNYSFTLNPGSYMGGPQIGAYTYSSLTSGTYIWTMTDANSCFVSGSISVLESSALLTVSSVPTAITCTGSHDGMINATISNGTAPYSYAWSGPSSFTATTEDLTGLSAGSYTLTVTDAYLCVKTTSAVVLEPNILNANIGKTDINCTGANDGTITVSNPSGGYGTYEYRLGTGAWQTSGLFSSLTPATYSVKIRDAEHTACFIDLGQLVLVTIIDITVPVITCPQAITINCQDSQLPVNTGGSATSTDNCDPTPAITYTDATVSGSCPNNYTITRTWKTTDYSSNTNTCAQIITVHDVTPPAFTRHVNITVYTNSGCSYNADPTITGDVIDENDNCSTGLEATYSDITVSGPYTGSHIITRTWSLVDNCGNHAADQVQTITVSDNERPVISNCPSNITQSYGAGQCSAIVTWTEPTAADNCTSSGNLVWNKSHTPGSIFPVGTTTVTYKATDAAGNTSLACSFNVYTIDVELPTISCVGNKIKNTDAGSCTYTVQGTEFNPLSFNDNCSGSTISNNYSHSNTLAGAIFPKGNTAVIWTVTDGSGNIKTCGFNVTVSDAETPTIVCVGNKLKNTDAGTSTYTVQGTEFNPVSYGDNCSSAVISNNYSHTNSLAGAVFPIGTTMVIWTVADESANTTTCTFNVTITGPELKAKVILQGAFITSKGVMNVKLDSLNLIPVAQPYNVTPWSYGGSERLRTTSPDIVDWVLVELRDANTTTVIDRRAGLLLKNGDIKDTNLTTGLIFTHAVVNNSYYITILHRNHLAVMSGFLVNIPSTVTYDFSDTLNFRPYGGGKKAMIQLEGLGAGKYAMIAGDVNNDGMISYSGAGNDRAPILQKLIALSGRPSITGAIENIYLQEDVNLNSVLLYSNSGNDRAIILTNLTRLNNSTSITGYYSTKVPGALIYNHKGFSDGPVDLIATEDKYNYYISLQTRQSIENGLIDNIQFTISWNANDLQTERLISGYNSTFNLRMQDNAKTIDGKKYIVFATADPNQLPEHFESGQSVVIMTIPKNGVNTVLLNNINLADDVNSQSLAGEYYVSVWGDDMTGNIIGNTTFIDDNVKDNLILSYYPNPALYGKFTINVSAESDQILTLKVYDVVGVCVYDCQLNVNAGTLFLKEVDLGTLSKGTYLIDVSNNKWKHSGKIIIF